VDGDRERWNAKWRERNSDLDGEAPLLSDNAQLFPRRGKALDLAGGAGRNAMWLMRRGMDVTLVDVSDVALDKAETRAKAAGLGSRLKTYHLDLEQPLPFAPLFDVVLVMNYLDRERRDSFAGMLVDDGLFVASHPTTGRFAVTQKELLLWARQLGFEILVAGVGEGEKHGEVGLIARRRAVKEPAEREPDEPSPSEGPYR
jgi:2-polyprenyl-3-methyl-5-hydroxy-6-metoxy-1,4-benzoquinol methylase